MDGIAQGIYPRQWRVLVKHNNVQVLLVSGTLDVCSGALGQTLETLNPHLFHTDVLHIEFSPL